MTQLYLTSQVQHVAKSIGQRLNLNNGTPLAYITTCIKDKPHSNLAWHYTNKKSLEDIGFDCIEYDISGKSNEELHQDLANFNYLYVEGGNSYYLLQEAQKNDFGEYLRTRLAQDLIYIGTSAGSVILGPDIEPVRRDETTPLAPDLKGTRAFNLVPFVIMSHWGSPERRNLYSGYRMKHIYHEDYPYIFISDNQYVEVVDGSWRIVSVS